MEKVALAFSGGLDTSVCVPLLGDEYGAEEVIGVTVDVGQPQAELDEARETAAALDLEHHLVDATDAFADLCLRSVRANAIYQGYPLGTALARPIIANAILEIAKAEGCDALAHGCTGKGNDQLRFEAVWRRSSLEVVAPVRELGLTRAWEIEYAAEHDIPVEAGNEGDWSIDANLWSRSIEGGELENPATAPPEAIYEWTLPAEARPSEPTHLTIRFEDGIPVGLDDETLEPVELIEQLNDLGGRHGVGRTDLMEDRMLGLKVRSNYEHPAATILLSAHEALEGLVLTHDERSFKRLVDDRWAEKAYEGLLDGPLVGSLEGFIDTTQSRVNGTVTMQIHHGHARPVARESQYAVYSQDAASFDTETVFGIEQADATGVAKYHGFQERFVNELDDGSDGTEV